MAEFIGRSIGSAVQYKIKVDKKKKFPFVFSVYQIYEIMDIILLWISYPLMLLNRAVCGFLGSNSATMRQAAVQSYIPDEFRARINAFETMLITAASSVFSLICGVLGELMDYKLCFSVCSLITLAASWIFIWFGRAHVRRIYERDEEESA